MEAAFSHHGLSDSRPRLDVGDGVLVRNSLNLWSPGFQVSGWRDGAYEVRRCSDGAVLPRQFEIEDLRPA
jgi:hypothetical protein